ncbi:MAG: hypothetical protein RR461_08345, partial [Angelakisella sp.]
AAHMSNIYDPSHNPQTPQNELTAKAWWDIIEKDYCYIKTIYDSFNCALRRKPLGVSSCA